MNVLVLGATGLVGRALSARLLREGHAVEAWVRSPSRASEVLGPSVRVTPVGAGDETLREAVGRNEAVVNVAGEPVLPRRWTSQRREELVASRVGVTTRLVDAIAASERKPGVLVSASAVGYYGDRGDELVDETSAPGRGFLAELCQAWELAAARASDAGVRVVLARLGVVLTGEGGMLGQVLPVFRMGLGGPLGSGQQRMAWIHVDDLTGVLVAALGDARFVGAVNATADRAVTNGDFTKALGRALRRPAVLRAPATVLRIVLGEASTALLTGQRVDPRRLREAGHQLRFTSIEDALADLLPATAALGPSS